MGAEERLAALEEDLREARAALAAIAAHDPYPTGVFTPLTTAEGAAVLEAIRRSGVPHALDRTHAQWGRMVGAQYAEMARKALDGEE